MASSTVQRKKQQRIATERELAILSLPAGLVDMEGYCRALDEKGIPFPEKWQQRKGWPKSHLEAWESKNKRLRNCLNSERYDVWSRAKKQVYVTPPAVAMEKPAPSSRSVLED